MEIKIKPDGLWYHGSNLALEELRAGSTVTQWRELAEAFSHKPTALSYEDDGCIWHNGREKGYLYTVDEPVEMDVDIYQHPRSTMDPGAEFLTRRALRLKLLKELS